MEDTTPLDAKGTDWLMWLAKAEDRALEFAERQIREEAEKPAPRLRPRRVRKPIA